MMFCGVRPSGLAPQSSPASVVAVWYVQPDGGEHSVNSRPPTALRMVTAALVVASGLIWISARPASASGLSPTSLVRNPSALVDPFAGTGAAPIAPGNVG